MFLINKSHFNILFFITTFFKLNVIIALTLKYAIILIKSRSHFDSLKRLIITNQRSQLSIK